MAQAQHYEGIPEVSRGPLGTIGSVAGSVAMFGVGLVGKGLFGLAKGGAKLGAFGVRTTGKGVIAGTKLTGTIATNFAIGAGEALADSVTHENYKNPVGKLLAGAKKAARALVDYQEGGYVNNLSKGKLEYRAPRLRLTGKGKVAVAAAALIGIGRDAMNENQKVHMGAADTAVTTATPDYKLRNYTAGATGDLVFALHNNRHG